jgi:hypothetical protein
MRVNGKISADIGVWRSLVADLLWERQLVTSRCILNERIRAMGFA